MSPGEIITPQGIQIAPVFRIDFFFFLQCLGRRGGVERVGLFGKTLCPFLFVNVVFFVNVKSKL